MGNMTWRQCVFTCRAAGLLLVLACLVASCKPTVPDKYIQPKDMEDILYDYYIRHWLGRGKGAKPYLTTRICITMPYSKSMA